MIRLVEITSDSCRLTLDGLNDCKELAVGLAPWLAAELPCVVGLVGNLGTGKTQWTKYFAEALGADPHEVSSPTFVLIHPIESRPKIYHIDAYRIHDADEFLELGIEELFEQLAITLIEWANLFPECMPKNSLWIEFLSGGTSIGAEAGSGALVDSESRVAVENDQSRTIVMSNLVCHPKIRGWLVATYGNEA